ncbi:MAG: helix-turn-helix domain-containing protein [Microcystis aeruginosa Ma_QC_C_20070823_S13]|nr:MAG: helix-turn-helix domain-containing protein [Microcystis aeruginosa Ma_QC_C_20070823_S13D]TRU64211.1 MAG: helix-turn-helix domain-containing protein [Microcystis aeruginosa Ma_QC_C_20070823_S13]
MGNPGRSFQQLNVQERLKLYHLRQTTNLSICGIAEKMGYSHTTLSRELKGAISILKSLTIDREKPLTIAHSTRYALVSQVLVYFKLKLHLRFY